MSDFVFRESQTSFSGFQDTSAGVDFKEIAKGDKGDPGRDFQVSGFVEAVADLPAGGEVGECWLVGTASPYNGYMWDGTVWVDIGPILEGPPGHDGDDYVLTQQDKEYIASLAVETIRPELDALEEDAEDKVLYFTGIAVSATTGDIASESNSAIVADHVVAECVFANPGAITGDVTWTTANGSLVLNGTCTSATTVNVVLVKKNN